MKNRLKKYVACVAILSMTIFSVGCNPISDIQKKFGFKNEYFEDIKNNSVDTISIQSTRDMRFKFIVTEDSAKKEMYGFLSKAKVSETKTNLEPDYIFEFKSGDEVKKYYYVAGTSDGNFYNDDLTLSVSKSLDEGIIKNLSFIRKPRDFSFIYYKSILDVLSKVKENTDLSNIKVGIDIQGDVECLKYVFSNDLKNFIEDAKKLAPNVELVKNNEEQYDLVLDVKNRGYDSTNYKTKVVVKNRQENSLDNYYVTALNTYKQWQINVSGANDIPKEW